MNDKLTGDSKPKSNFAHIQEMHERQLVTRESVINWYLFYANKLPKMTPERSDADLIRTIALWMELTDKGGSPEFPFDYKTDITIPKFSAETKKADPFFTVNLLLLISGLIAIFIKWKLGLGLIGLGILSMIVNYLFRGGSKNYESVVATTDGQRVIEWIKNSKKD
jgi:hypothetical protein